MSVETPEGRRDEPGPECIERIDLIVAAGR